MADKHLGFTGKKNIPAGVKIIAVLFYIGAVLFLISGTLSIAGLGLPQENLTGAAVGVPQLGRGFEVVGGIISIGLAVFVFFVGLGNWKLRRWARISAIVLSVIGIIISLISMIGGGIVGNLITLIIYAGIGGYMLFSKDVKEVFV